MILSRLIRETEPRLAKAGVDNPPLDARILIAHALHIDRAQLLGQSDHDLTPKEEAEIEKLIARRAHREPVSRILGSREFWSLDFVVNEATLVPRPESETLVEAVLDIFKDRSQQLRILDLGTGSGCLLLTLLHELPNATGLGIDCAPRAIEQAKENAERLGLSARSVFKVNNWVDGIDEHFDIVISNPPYIVKTDIEKLMPEVREFDPHIALDGGEDGFEIYRFLIPQLPHLLKPNGFTVFEIGEGQAEKIRRFFQELGFLELTIHKDLANIERCITGMKIN